jgi:three-Cys-motif partner protein
MKNRLDLGYVKNPNCKQGCNKSDRLELTENELCTETISVVDSLPIRCAGEWATQKIYYLVQYFGIFANGMKNKWGGKLNYVEICCGPGRCIARENGIEFDGTALSIIKHNAFQHINKALFFDINAQVVETLNKRISKTGVKNAQAIVGNYYEPNSICQNILLEIQKDSLNLIFIDPTDCSVPFTLIKALTEALSKVDFIINLASRTDFNRNVLNSFLKPDSFSNSIKKYSSFLNSTDFFYNPLNIQNARDKRNIELRKAFRQSYVESMKNIGYLYFDYNNINHFYDILFATTDEKGISFWRKANKINFDGQRKLF